MKKRLLSICLSVFVIIATLTGCGDKNIATVVKYDTEKTPLTFETQTVANNNNYELFWNSEGSFVGIKDKTTERIWSTVPYDYFLEGGSSANVNSPINITIQNTTSMALDTLRGYSEAIEQGRVFAEKADNGIKVTYCFDNYKISVPVLYQLNDNSVKVTVLTNEIIEETDYRLIAVSVAPFMCSAKSTDDKNSYLVLPVGSGALMYTDLRAEGIRSFSGEVYGTDASRIVPEETNDEEKINLPIFGAKDGDNAILAIIDGSAESAVINAEAGNKKTGYANAYATFYVRGYDTFATTQWLWSYKDLDRISEDMITADCSVSYYPLDGENADYIGMAQKYSDYLENNKQLEKSNTDSELYSLNILGGVTVKSAAFGIPHKTLSVLTDFNSAKEIVSDISDKTGETPIVKMTGYGSTGIDVGKIAGGFGFDSSFGKLKTFSQYCTENGVNAYYDFDLIRYSKSGNGFSYLNSAAKTATLHVAELAQINTPLRDYDTSNEYRFLKRSKVSKAVDKLIKMLDKKGIENVSLSSMSSLAYSDFTDYSTAVKGNTENDVTEYINRIKNSGKNVAVSSANAYAAVAGDVILDTVVGNGDYMVFDKTIPFYQTVFSGYKTMYSQSINIAENTSKEIMLCVTSGVRFGFTVTGSFDMNATDTKTEKIYATDYETVKKQMENLVEDYSDFYKKIDGEKIVDYQLLENNISKTVFENQVTVLGNHSSQTVECDGYTLEPYGVAIING